MTYINEDSLCLSPTYALQEKRSSMLSQIRAFIKNAVICQNGDF